MRRSSFMSLSALCIIPLLCLAACAGEPTKGGNSGTAVNHWGKNVVLLDPTTDDGMLPALGEGLSRGAVTIYNLDAPPAPLPAQAITPQPAPIIMMPMTAQPAITLYPPADMTGHSDPRVTIFGPGGAPVAMRMAEPSLPKVALPPPTPQTPIKSPFTPNGALAKPTPPPPSAKASWWLTPPAAPTSDGSSTLGNGKRAVTTIDLMAPAVKEPTPIIPDAPVSDTPRPPKGMTY